MHLSNLTILIIGISNDIGYTLGTILNEYGASVIGTYNKHALKNAPFKILKLDITNELEVHNIMQSLKDENIDVVVNCSAISNDADIYDKTLNEFMDVVKVNLGGSFLCVKEASKIMNRGVIINISSTDGIDTFNPLSLDYCASKAALNNLTQNLALRFPNLKICALAPNWVNTKSVLEMDPHYLHEEMQRINQKELLKKEDVALKIIEIMLDSDIISGSIIRMDDHYE